MSVQWTDINNVTESENNVALVSISADGIMSDDSDSSLHGVMSLDKNIVVFTDTWDGAGTYALTVLVKGGGSFTQSDLVGTWQGHTLTTGSEEVWEYDTTTIDSQGVVSSQITDSNGNTESNYDEATLSIASNGELSVAGSTTFHGVMNPDKDIVVITEIWAQGIYALSIATKADDTVPVSGFSASHVTGSIPLEVAFSDTSSGDITGWLWDFGDGSTSTAQNPTHTYTRAGTYAVSLTVNGTGGSDVETKTDYIKVKSGAMPWLSLLLTEDNPFTGTFNFSEQYDLNISNGVILGTGTVKSVVTQTNSNKLTWVCT